jgi:KDO2-lipid IV(A) lauroyltransferase
VSRAHALEAFAVSGLSRLASTLPRNGALAIGSAFGLAVGALGVRARVARENLARAFPETPAGEREAILAGHYRELGRVALEYPRIPDLVRLPDGEVVAGVDGIENFEAARGAGRGALMVSGHFGLFELMGGWMAQRHPVSFLVKPLSNPRVERWIRSIRERAGAELINTGSGTRGVLRALQRNRWVCILADQDARREGVFVPFFGVPASTPRGPAAIALRTGVPIIMAFIERQADGRHRLEFQPPLALPPAGDPDPERTLTAAHVRALEERIRRRPDQYFWLHKRWKTAPPAAAAEAGIAGGPVSR